MRRSLALASIVFAIAQPGAAQTFDEAMARYNSAFTRDDPQEFEAARLQVQDMAERGEAKAQAFLGALHLSEGDCPEATKWLGAAAEQGSAAGQAELGKMYATAHCVPLDCAAAEAWLLKAADQDNIGSQYWIASMYETGTCASPDLVKAHMWFNVAAANPKAGADTLRRYAISERNMIEAQMTPEQIDEAEDQARSWTSRRAR